MYYFLKSFQTTQNFTKLDLPSSSYYSCSSTTCRYVWCFQDNFCRKPAIFPSTTSVQPMGCHRTTEAATLWWLLALTLKDLQFEFNFEQNVKWFSALNHQSREHVGRKPRFRPTGLGWGRLAWSPCSRLLGRTSVATTSPLLPQQAGLQTLPAHSLYLTSAPSSSAFSW